MAQVLKKFIGSNAVGGPQTRLENNTYLRARNAANSADINLFRINASDLVEFAQDFSPLADLTQSIGSSTVRWNQIYADGMSDGSGISALNITARQLEDSGSDVSIDWDARTLHDSTGANMVDYSTAGTLTLNTLTIAGVVDPVNPQEAATKAYVDAAVGGAFAKENLTLNGTDITNQYKDLAEVIKASSLVLCVNSAGVVQTEGVDYTVSLTGGAGGNTRITFAGDLATGGGAALISGDVMRFQYAY